MQDPPSLVYLTCGIERDASSLSSERMHTANPIKVSGSIQSAGLKFLQAMALQEHTEHTIGVNRFLLAETSLEWMPIESKREEDTTQPELGFAITHHRSPA